MWGKPKNLLPEQTLKGQQFYFQEMPKDGMLLKISGQKNCEIKEYEM